MLKSKISLFVKVYYIFFIDHFFSCLFLKILYPKRFPKWDLYKTLSSTSVFEKLLTGLSVHDLSIDLIYDLCIDE